MGGSKVGGSGSPNFWHTFLFFIYSSKEMTLSTLKTLVNVILSQNAVKLTDINIRSLARKKAWSRKKAWARRIKGKKVPI